MTFILYPLLTTALYYLLSRAQITRPLWSRYPGWLDRFLLCSACSGFWYGTGIAAVGGGYVGLPFLGLDGALWWSWPTVGLCSIVWTPLIADWHTQALYRLGGEQTPDTTAPQEGESSDAQDSK